MPSAYNHLKAFRHHDVIEGFRILEPRRVPHVQLILSDLCQQHCVFCAYRMSGYTSNQHFDERRMIKPEKALEIIEDCREIGVQAIQFTGGGEPTIHPAFAETVQAALDCGLKVSLVSNGVRITPELASLLVKGSWVRISMDAAREETYVNIRKIHKSHWQKAQDAIRSLREQRDSQKTDCVIGTSFVATPENWREVVAAARLMKSLGADNFRVTAQFSTDDATLYDGIENEVRDLCAKAEEESDSDFTVYNCFAGRMADLEDGSPDYDLCGHQFFNTYIGADLGVYRCCAYAYNDRGFIGSLRNQRFKDFWMARERFENQRKFNARSCVRCPFHKQNRALAYVLDPTPQLHEEFV